MLCRIILCLLPVTRHLSLVTISQEAFMPERTYPFGKGIIKLISTDWLEINAKAMMILDVQPNIHDYIKEHIPGAIYLNEGLLRGYKGHLPALWNPPEAIQPVLRNAGLSPDKPIVVYT